MGTRLLIVGVVAYCLVGGWVGVYVASLICRKHPPKSDGSDDWAVGVVVVGVALVWPLAALWLGLRFTGSGARERATRAEEMAS